MTHYKRYIFGTIGIALVVLGCALELYWSKIITHLIEQQMVLSTISSTYQGWKSSPLPLHLDIYIFNWTNPIDIRNHSTKPILNELGPYSFIEKPDKVNIMWYPKNSSVSFNRESYFYFDKNNSIGDLSDEINTVNMLALGAAGKSKDLKDFGRLTVSLGLELFGQEIFVHKTADELLFTGYQDKMLDFSKSPLLFFLDNVEIPFDRVGYFYTRNGSANAQGNFNVYTGADDFQKLGQIHTWNYKNQTDCSNITGTSAGEFFPKNVMPNDTLKLFIPDMCTTLILDYVATVTIHGVEGYKFAAGRRSVDNGTNYNVTRCASPSEGYPSGVISLSKCKYNASVFSSYPHYLHADPFYQEQVEGLKANKDKHEFYIVVEPTTGGVMEVAARIQLNALLEEFPNISIYSQVKETFIPLIWSEQKVTISPEMADDIKLIPKLLTAGYIVSGLTVFLGIVIIAWVVIISIVLRTKVEKRKEILNNLYPCESPLLDKRKLQIYTMNQKNN